MLADDALMVGIELVVADPDPIVDEAGPVSVIEAPDWVVKFKYGVPVTDVEFSEDLV